MSDVVVSVVETSTDVAVTETSVDVNVTETTVSVITGTSGAQGATGSAGIGYTGIISASTITIGSGLKTFTLVSSYAGAFVTGMRIRAIHSDTPTYFLEGTANYVGGGTLIITVDKFNGSGSHNSWMFAVAGEVGQTGSTGATGATGATGSQGPAGVVAATAPITYDSGTQTIGITQSGITIAPSQVTGTAVITTDSRLSDARTPTTHASSHASGGSDAVTLAQSQVTNLTTDLAAKAALTASQTFTGTQTFLPAATSATPLVGKAITGQTGDLFQLQNAAGTKGMYVTSGFGLYTTGLFTGRYIQDFTGTAPYIDIDNSANRLRINARSASNVGLVVIGAASQSANLQEWQTSDGSVQTVVNSSGGFGTNQRGTFGTTAISSLAHLTVTQGVSGRVSFGVQNTQSGNTADLGSYFNSSSTVIGGRNANAQIYTGSTAPLTTAVGGATTAASGNGTTATLTTTSNHNLAVGDRITVAGVTPTAYNGTFIVTAAATNSVSYASTATGAQTVAGTVSVDAQASITSRSAATTGIIYRIASSQASDALVVQNATGSTSLARIESSGQIRGAAVSTLNSNLYINETNSGGYVRWQKQTAANFNPGADKAVIYFRDGTNAGTLKLVVRAGAAGAETTILDNIPQ